MSNASKATGRRRTRPSKIVFHVVLVAYSMLFFLPLLWMAMSAFKTNGAIFQDPFALPTSWDFSVFSEAWRAGGIGRYALNSAIVTGVTTGAVLLLGSMAAYAFARFEFRGGGLLLGLFTLGLILPVQSYFVAQNWMFEALHIKDTRCALILPYTAMGLSLAIWLLKAYLQSLPRELFEAARVDGAGDVLIFRRIVLPLLKPGLATVAVFTVLSAWNEFLLALLYIQDESLKTIPVGLLAFSTKYVTDYRLLFAALTMVTVPMVAVYAMFNRQVVAGLTEGSMK